MSRNVPFGYKISLKIRLISNFALHGMQTKWAEDDFCNSVILCVSWFKINPIEFAFIPSLHIKNETVQDGWIHILYEMLTIYDEAGLNGQTVQCIYHECFLILSQYIFIRSNNSFMKQCIFQAWEGSLLCSMEASLSQLWKLSHSPVNEYWKHCTWHERQLIWKSTC